MGGRKCVAAGKEVARVDVDHIGSHLSSGASKGLRSHRMGTRSVRGSCRGLAIGSSLNSASGNLPQVVMMQTADQS